MQRSTHLGTAGRYSAALISSPLLRMTALCDTSNLKSSIASDIFVEMLFILDIIFNFRMTFVNEKGEVVEAGKDIALHYIKGRTQ